MNAFPIETLLAADPQPVAVDGLTLRPPTVGDVLTLARLGVDFGVVTRENAIVYAWVLSRAGGGFDEFVVGFSGDLDRLVGCLASFVDSTLSTYVRPRPKKGEISSVVRGFGWPLEIAECLCGEYGWSYREALETPIATAFGLIAANRRRNNVPDGDFDYYDREILRRKKCSKKA